MIKTILPLSIIAALLAPATETRAAEPSAPRKTSAWLPYWDTDRGLASFKANADLFDQLLPFWYEMRDARTVDPMTADRQRVLDAARAAGVKVLPTVSNSFDPVRISRMLSDDLEMYAHIQTLVGLTEGVDGIDVDYEGLHESDRDRFSLFVERLATALHEKGKLLSMTVHPKTSEPGSWSGPRAQDWARIGAVADRVRLMAYDYHWASSDPGGIAPLSWVEQVAAFAVTQIPASKVDLGMPLYGYDWLGRSGTGVTWEQAESRRTAAGATLSRSTDGLEPWFRYTSAGQTRTVWFSDGISTAQKLSVVTRHGLRGHTFWRLGGEDPDVWSRVRSWSGGTPPPTVDEEPPTRVKKPRAKGRAAAVKLTWAAADDESTVRYRILRATSSKGRFKRIATVNRLAFQDRRVRSQKRYWYAVRAVDGEGNAARRSRKVAAAPR